MGGWVLVTRSEAGAQAPAPGDRIQTPRPHSEQTRAIHARTRTCMEHGRLPFPIVSEAHLIIPPFESPSGSRFSG